MFYDRLLFQMNYRYVIIGHPIENNMNSMKKKIILLIPLLTFMLFGLHVAAQQEWSLEKCINYAFENTLQIKQSKLNEQSSKEDFLQSKLNFLPTFNVSTSQSTGWGRSIDMAPYSYTNTRPSQASGP